MLAALCLLESIKKGTGKSTESVLILKNMEINMKVLIVTSKLLIIFISEAYGYQFLTSNNGIPEINDDEDI